MPASPSTEAAQQTCSREGCGLPATLVAVTTGAWFCGLCVPRRLKVRLLMVGERPSGNAEDAGLDGLHTTHGDCWGPTEADCLFIEEAHKDCREIVRGVLAGLEKHGYTLTAPEVPFVHDVEQYPHCQSTCTSSWCSQHGCASASCDGCLIVGNTEGSES